MNSSRKFLICKGSSGMGNRILAACGAIIYSEISNRQLVIDWRDNTYCHDNINSFPLFFNCPKTASVESIPDSKSVYPEIWIDKLDQSFGGLRKDLRISDQSMSVELSRTNYESEILVFCAYTHKINQMRQLFHGKFDYLAKMDDRTIIKQVLNSHLSLKPEIVQSIEDFRSSYFGVNTLGVHVRYTDMKIPLDKLITNTKKINKNNKFNSIFLSTDSQEVVEKFQQEFPNIITTPKWFPPSGERMHQNWDQCPDRVQNGREALMDMYLLASCNDLIFSSQSSFGLVASILSKASKQHLHDVNSSSFIEKVKAKIRGIAK
jgi:hypothetical protein